MQSSDTCHCSVHIHAHFRAPSGALTSLNSPWKSVVTLNFTYYNVNESWKKKWESSKVNEYELTEKPSPFWESEPLLNSLTYMEYVDSP